MSALCTIGIDPGVTGAAALMIDGLPIAVDDMPAVKPGKTLRVSPVLLRLMLQRMADLCDSTPFAILENVASRPGQGVASAFNFGRSYGVTEGIIEAVGLRMIRVQPAAWKKRAKLPRGADKERSRVLALELFPEMADRLSRKKDHNRAEALLIARFGV